jgi:hypothetical protein
MQKQQQKLIHNNKKNRILIVNGDNPNNHAILKLDLESPIPTKLAMSPTQGLNSFVVSA